MAAIMAVFEFPPKFSRNNHVNTESRYGIKSAFFDFLFFDAYSSGEKNQIKYIDIQEISKKIKLYTYRLYKWEFFFVRQRI